MPRSDALKLMGQKVTSPKWLVQYFSESNREVKLLDLSGGDQVPLLASRARKITYTSSTLLEEKEGWEAL